MILEIPVKRESMIDRITITFTNSDSLLSMCFFGMIRTGDSRSRLTVMLLLNKGWSNIDRTYWDKKCAYNNTVVFFHCIIWTVIANPQRPWVGSIAVFSSWSFPHWSFCYNVILENEFLALMCMFLWSITSIPFHDNTTPYSGAPTTPANKNNVPHQNANTIHEWFVEHNKISKALTRPANSSYQSSWALSMEMDHGPLGWSQLFW